MTNNCAPGGPETILILDHDRVSATASARALASGARLVLTGCDAALATLVARRTPLSVLVTEAQIAGPFCFDGLDAISDVRASSPDCRVVVTSDGVSSTLSNEAVRRGASVLLRPLDDRSFRETLGYGERSEPGAIVHIPTVEEFIASEHLLPAFQPIVDLTGGAAGLGFESLARYRQAIPFFDPCFMFEYARQRGMTVELDLACLRRSISAARDLARQGKIFLNVHPRALAAGRQLVRTLVEEAGDCEVPLTSLVLEITEQEKLATTAETRESLDELRAYGVQFALDDVGVSYSHLDLIDSIRPSYLKISQEFGTDFEKDPSRQKIIRNIVSLAQDFECEIILEGVETAATSQAASEIGARYAQGFFYARPSEPAMLMAEA
jgi:EAL domain-containing protein (putative c-di-GMP-specific phosphodiesterase class I)